MNKIDLIQALKQVNENVQASYGDMADNPRLSTRSVEYLEEQARKAQWAFELVMKLVEEHV